MLGVWLGLVFRATVGLRRKVFVGLPPLFLFVFFRVLLFSSGDILVQNICEEWFSSENAKWLYGYCMWLFEILEAVDLWKVFITPFLR